jgi:hypothetical protein
VSDPPTSPSRSGQVAQMREPRFGGAFHLGGDRARPCGPARRCCSPSSRAGPPIRAPRDQLHNARPARRDRDRPCAGNPGTRRTAAGSPAPCCRAPPVPSPLQRLSDASPHQDFWLGSSSSPPAACHVLRRCARHRARFLLYGHRVGSVRQGAKEHRPPVEGACFALGDSVTDRAAAPIAPLLCEESTQFTARPLIGRPPVFEAGKRSGAIMSPGSALWRGRNRRFGRWR